MAAGATAEASERVGRLGRCAQRQEKAMVVRPPFSVRQNPERLDEFHALHEGVPAGLRPSLLSWTKMRYASYGPTFTDEAKVGT